MKNLSIAFLAAVSLMSFAGCKKKAGGADVLAKTTEFKDQMCKCTDKACADKVNEAYMKWGQDMAKEAGENKEASENKDASKLSDVTKAYADCMMKASGAAMPPAGDKPAAPPAGDKPADPNAAGTPPAPAGEKPADPNAATPPAPAGEKPAEPAAGTPPAPAGDKPAAK